MSDKPRFYPNRTNAPAGGGWRYTVPETSAYIVGTTEGQLIENVKKHYVANDFHVPFGLRELVEEQICRDVPDYCVPDGPELKPVKKQQHRFVHEIVSGTKTLWSWLVTGGGASVEAEEAERRAAICVGCVENQEPGGCTSCALAAMLQQIARIAPGETSQGDKLKACRACGCSLKAKVWVPTEILQKNMPQAIKDDLPAHCWVNGQ